jgi:hypothetical protein
VPGSKVDRREDNAAMLYVSFYPWLFTFVTLMRVENGLCRSHTSGLVTYPFVMMLLLREDQRREGLSTVVQDVLGIQHVHVHVPSQMPLGVRVMIR